MTMANIVVRVLLTNGETTADPEGLCGTIQENIKLVKGGGCGRAEKKLYNNEK